MSNLKFSFNYKSAMKYLVGLSVILSMFSWYTSRVGLGELYPFFFYKLFSQPRGTKGFDDVLRVYIRHDNKMVRRPMEAIKSYSQDDISYSLEHYVSDSINGNRKLSILLNHLYPNQGPYWVYKEIYNPSEILKHKEHYDTVFVAKVQ